MRGITLCKISKLLIYILLVYLLWFRYAFSVKNAILYSVAFLAAVCMLCDLLISYKSLSEVFPTGVLINIIMCIYSLVIGTFVARNQEYLITAVKTYGAFSIVCLVICYIVKEEKSFEWLLNAIIAVDILCAFFIITRGYYWGGYGYVLGPEHNPNSCGLAMDLGLFCLIYRTQKNRKKLILSVSIAILFLYIIIGCGSRKCMLVAIILCALWIFQESRKVWSSGSWMKRIVLLLFIALILVSVAYYYENVFSSTDISVRMETFGDNSEESSRYRKLYYRLAIDYFLEKPLFGIGLQQFVVWNPLKQYSHSTYAEAVADWGLIGCLIYFIPVIWAVIMLIKSLFSGADNTKERSILALWIMEIFLGVGQIWFFEIIHLIAWTIIFLYIDMSRDSYSEKRYSIGRKCKYVKA